VGERGPPPIPTALKLAAGNPGRRTLNDDEPVPPPGAIDPPEFVASDERARRVWDAVAPIAQAMKTLTTADVLAFGRYCLLYARFLELTESLKVTGRTYERKDESGGIVYVGERPEASEWRRLPELLIRLEKEFGLTAASRSRIRVELAAGGVAGGQSADAAAKRDFFRKTGA
jgi:P27 family predicted phage terminase small subunit